MSKASVDPAELRRFAQGLTQFNNDLQQLLGSLHARMRSLENTWRDQEQRKFSEEFDQTAKMLSHFLEVSHEHARTLTKKAQHIEKYLGEN